VSTETLKAIVIDDEATARLAIKRRLHDVTRQIEVIGEAANSREGSSLVCDLNPDVIFLDISMPGESGLRFARRLQNEGSPVVVFLTAYGDRAVEAFETQALDYLMKPVSGPRLALCVERILTEHDRRRKLAFSDEMIRAAHSLSPNNYAYERPKSVSVRSGGRELELTLSEILFLESAGEYTQIRTSAKTVMVRTSLSRLLSEKFAASFIRVNRQSAINLVNVERIDWERSVAKLSDGSQIAISRRNVPRLRQKLSN